jgi:hypothetical protein
MVANVLLCRSGASSYASFDVLHLLAHFFGLAFDLDCELRKSRVLRFGTHRVNFAVDFLEQELDGFADRLGAIE